MPGRAGSAALPARAPIASIASRIGLEIARGVGGGARALAQHVEGIAELAVRCRRATAPPRWSGPSTKCEPSSRIAWRVAARTAGRPSRLTRLSTMPSGRLARMDDARRDAERPGRGRDQERARAHSRLRPVAGGELVLDQPVGGRGVRHAQQRLGQHHQRQALLGRERIGVQEILDAAEPAGMGADRLDQPPGAGIDARLGGRAARRRGQQRRRQRLVRRRIGRGKAGTPVPASGLDALIACLGVGPKIASRILPVYQRRRRPHCLPRRQTRHSDVQKLAALCAEPTACAAVLPCSFIRHVLC